ncbi:unnamed protein product [Mytilus edulis]|uniref:Tesmin/TSO1-like CXC domain-containing protein n=1 Tax=Mytilus edulis TaxID=6550 RepID=A0A8S3QL54_MYTED|nr:unnamed protein product [Mytilus edulis]
MGIIAASTPGIKTARSVPRTNPSIKEITALAKINIKFYKEQSNSFQKLKYEVFEKREKENKSWKLDLLSKICWPLKFSASWSAIMHKTSGSYPGQSNITFLPMIDINPSDESCIYTTLHFVCKEAKQNKCTPILTFDQPLYWKAMMIVQNEPTTSSLKSLVLKLGGFHAEMSFVGSIGYLMSGSGLMNIFETVYASTAVSHMLSGKAIARAVRGHFLLDTALTALILSNIYGIPVPKIEVSSEENAEGNLTQTYDTSKVQIHDTCYTEEVSHATDLLDLFSKGDVCLADVNQSNSLDTIKDKIQQFRHSRSKYKTANLWFQYMDMICILRDFIKAERTGNWTLHLESLKAMLPYFTASGHNLYAKSAWIYLNQMECLKDKHAEVAALFEAGYHVIRRTDQYWAGISSDLAIEQALMRSIKTTGRLTRGRGMSESQRALWILSMPDCAEINSAMMSFTGTKFYSSDQHKEDGVSRQKRDTKDRMIFASFLEERNPFIEEEGMRNIETGVSATSDVNTDRGKDIGLSILKSMEGKCVSDFTFKRKHQAITLQDKPICVYAEPEIATIDPQLLFQRFIVASDSIYEDKSEIFSYELSSQPSSMFDSSGFMRAASKSTLADTIWNLGDCTTEYTDTVYSYVVDGGSLMHKIPWKSGLTFGEICKRYVDSVKCNGTNSVVVVLDGYVSGPDTKDAMHLKRTKGISGTKVTFTETTPFRSKKETFLANNENKQNFIEMLSKKMHSNDVKNAGEKVITFLYGGVPHEGLDILRYKKFANRVLTCKEVIQIHTLPPTTETATYHSLRTYFQVQTWIGGEEIDPCDFGWLIVNGKLMPIMTKRQPTPQRLLLIIRCNCKTNCDTRRCTCRKHGLECNISCGECRGQSCMNSRHGDIDVEADELFSDSS